MKRNLLFWIAGLFFLAGCNDDADTTPNEAVVQAFQAKYPSASQIEWETRSSYLKADFTDNQQSHSAWFDQNGQWYMTETELNRLDLLPQEVQTAFANSEYADWMTDDIDRLERNDTETVYIIEVKNGNQEYDLYYSPDGVLIKAVPDNDNDDYENYLPLPTPAAIADFINNKYPEARIVDIEKEQGRTEVDIIYSGRSMEVVFNSAHEWLNTHYDVLATEVEQVVLQALQASDYAGYSIDDIEKYETPNEAYYLFELEKGDIEIKVKIDLQGNLNQTVS